MKPKALVITKKTSLSLKKSRQLMLVTEHILNAKALSIPKIRWLDELVTWAIKHHLSHYRYNQQLGRWQGFPHNNKEILQLQEVSI